MHMHVSLSIAVLSLSSRCVRPCVLHGAAAGRRPGDRPGEPHNNNANVSGWCGNTTANLLDNEANEGALDKPFHCTVNDFSEKQMEFYQIRPFCDAADAGSSPPGATGSLPIRESDRSGPAFVCAPENKALVSFSHRMLPCQSF